MQKPEKKDSTCVIDLAESNKVLRIGFFKKNAITLQCRYAKKNFNYFLS